jgi:hypothetical protein
MGIEPTLSAWEAEVLPLNYTRKRNFQIFYAIFPAGQLSMKQLFTGKIFSRLTFCCIKPHLRGSFMNGFHIIT